MNLEFADMMYLLIGGYLVLMGITGLNLTLFWITFRMKIKFFDLEHIYGRVPARIIFIILGALVLVFQFVIRKMLPW